MCSVTSEQTQSSSNSADEPTQGKKMSLKNEKRLLLPWVGLVVTLLTFVLAYITSVVKPVLIFVATSIIFKSCLRAELWALLCFHGFEHFACVPTRVSVCVCVCVCVCVKCVYSYIAYITVILIFYSTTRKSRFSINIKMSVLNLDWTLIIVCSAIRESSFRSKDL